MLLLYVNVFGDFPPCQRDCGLSKSLQKGVIVGPKLLTTPFGCRFCSPSRILRIIRDFRWSYSFIRTIFSACLFSSYLPSCLQYLMAQRLLRHSLSLPFKILHIFLFVSLVILVSAFPAKRHNTKGVKKNWRCNQESY